MPAVSPQREDPVVRSSRREGLAALAVWLAAMLYCVLYCRAAELVTGAGVVSAARRI